MIKYIDLFCGIGGFRLAIGKKGKCVFSSDHNKQAQETYMKNFKDTVSGDITEIQAKDIPEFNLLCGGFPCQSFSSAGRQRGFDDTRGTLFFDILRIAEFNKPKVLFLENVANLVNHDQGKTFKVMREKLESLGYKVSSKVLNAKDFGLAQNRERIFIVASLDKVFDFSKVKNKKEVKIKDILEPSNNYLKKKEYTILKKKDWKTQRSGLIFCGYLKKNIRVNGVANPDKKLSRVHRQPNRIYSVDGTHPTLSAQETAGRYFIYDGAGVRKLTLNEAYKLQGFPSKFKKNETRTEALRQLGNSVPVSVLKAIFKEIEKQLY